MDVHYSIQQILETGLPPILGILTLIGLIWLLRKLMVKHKNWKFVEIVNFYFVKGRAGGMLLGLFFIIFLEGILAGSLHRTGQYINPVVRFIGHVGLSFLAIMFLLNLGQMWDAVLQSWKDGDNYMKRTAYVVRFLLTLFASIFIPYFNVVAIFIGMDSLYWILNLFNSAPLGPNGETGFWYCIDQMGPQGWTTLCAVIMHFVLGFMDLTEVIISDKMPVHKTAGSRARAKSKNKKNKGGGGSNKGGGNSNSNNDDDADYHISRLVNKFINNSANKKKYIDRASNILTYHKDDKMQTKLTITLSNFYRRLKDLEDDKKDNNITSAVYKKKMFELEEEVREFFAADSKSGQGLNTPWKKKGN